jgi:hypothetical protein
MHARRPDEREVLIFGLSSYDPGGRTGDTHASEAVGGSCQVRCYWASPTCVGHNQAVKNKWPAQTVLTAIVISEIFALLLGASESQVQSIHDCTVPLIDALHGRRTAAEWLLRQTKEALLFPGGSGLPLGESFPRFSRVYWVAVPQALRARRVNSACHLVPAPPAGQGRRVASEVCTPPASRCDRRARTHAPVSGVLPERGQKPRGRALLRRARPGPARAVLRQAAQEGRVRCGTVHTKWRWGGWTAPRAHAGRWVAEPASRGRGRRPPPSVCKLRAG